MPTFHCIHCGQRIDAEDSLKGTEAECPTCGGAILVPGLRKPFHPSPNYMPAGHQKCSEKSTSTSLGFPFIVVMVIGIVIAMIVGDFMGDTAARKAAHEMVERKLAQTEKERHEETSGRTVPGREPAAPAQLVTARVAGLVINVPQELAAMTREDRPYDDVATVEAHTGVYRTRGILIKRLRYLKEDAPPPRIGADLTEGDLSIRPGYESTRRTTKVSGLDAMILETIHGPPSHRVHQTILYITKDGDIWEIHVYGVNDRNVESLKAMEAMVFDSVRIDR